MKLPQAGTTQVKVLDYLLTGHSLDLPKATAMWGHIRLSDVILKLRKKGHNIVTGMIEVAGSNKEFAYYVLSKKPWKGTLAGTKVKVLTSDSEFFNKEAEVVEVCLANPFPVFLKFPEESVNIPFGFSELEVIYG